MDVLNGLKETIQALCQLQQMDDIVREHVVARERLNEKLKQLHVFLERIGQSIEEKRKRLHEAERWYETKSGELKSDQDKVARAKAKLGMVTKTKEYLAMQRELESLRKSNTQKEEEILKLLEAIEEFKTSIENEEAKLRSCREEAASEEATNAGSVRELDALIEANAGKRRETAAAVPPAILKQYERVKGRAAGVAIVEVRDERCGGCNLRLPPQVYIRLLRQQSLETCPSCARFIFVDPDVVAKAQNGDKQPEVQNEDEPQAASA
jgi:predicted  nucleic acid-binding Zn-ribbon protein